MQLNFSSNFGFENYWQITFLVLGILVIGCNIGLMFVNEPQPVDRANNQRQTDKMIEDKLGSPNILTKNDCLVNWNCNWSGNKFL